MIVEVDIYLLLVAWCSKQGPSNSGKEKIRKWEEKVKRKEETWGKGNKKKEESVPVLTELGSSVSYFRTLKSMAETGSGPISEFNVRAV
ncbi:hypothetical protein IMZ48_01110 [Candidatus Bathyarchaeota archaeon]|nr:hypothetical protein [Candidatus Bathyarchaeota archaeon]